MDENDPSTARAATHALDFDWTGDHGVHVVASAPVRGDTFEAGRTTTLRVCDELERFARELRAGALAARENPRPAPSPTSLN